MFARALRGRRGPVLAVALLTVLALWFLSEGEVEAGPSCVSEAPKQPIVLVAPQRGAGRLRQWLREAAPGAGPADVAVLDSEPCDAPRWLLDDPPGGPEEVLTERSAPRRRVLVLQEPAQAVVSLFQGRLGELEECVLENKPSRWGSCGVSVNPVTAALGDDALSRFDFVDVWKDLGAVKRLLGVDSRLTGTDAEQQPSARVLARLAEASAADTQLYNTARALSLQQFDDQLPPHVWQGRFSLALDRQPVSLRQADDASPRVYGVLAAAATRNYLEIFDEQWFQLLHSGLLERTDALVVSVLGDEHITDEFRVPVPNRWTNVAVMTNVEKTLWEAPALQKLHSMCVDDPEGYAYYIHTKGVRSDGQFKGGGQHRTTWRRYLMYALVDHWRETLAELQSGVPVVGAMRGEDTPYGRLPHYSGNFWWASCRYLASLPSPMYYMVHHPPQHAGDVRLHLHQWAEFWVGSGGADKLGQCFQKRGQGEWADEMRYSFSPRADWEEMTENVCTVG